MKHSPAFLTLVADAKERVKEIRPEDVKQKIDRKERFWLIDVREDGEWNLGHLPGAVHICKGIIERDIGSAIQDTDADIILYCGGGYRSVLAGDNLQKMGYTKVASMSGGWRQWIALQYPTA